MPPTKKGAKPKKAKTAGAKKTIQKAAAPARKATHVYTVLSHGEDGPRSDHQAWISGVYTTAAAANAKAVSEFLYHFGEEPADAQKVKTAAKPMKLVELRSLDFDFDKVDEDLVYAVRVEKHRVDVR